MLLLGIPLVIIGGVITYSNIQRLYDKGYWGGAWWKTLVALGVLSVGVFLMVGRPAREALSRLPGRGEVSNLSPLCC